MDYERVTGFTDSGQFCVWCSCHYPDSAFRQSIDVCNDCETFRQKHNYDLGVFIVTTVRDSKYRVFLRYDVKMNNSEVRDAIEKSVYESASV